MDDKLKEELATLVSSAVQPLAEKVDQLQGQVEEAAEVKQEPETKPEPSGSTDGVEGEELSEEELTQAVADGVAEALHEVE